MTAIHCPRGHCLSKLVEDPYIVPLSWRSAWSRYHTYFPSSPAVYLMDTAALIYKQRGQPPVNRAGSPKRPGVDPGPFGTVSQPGPKRVNSTRSTLAQNTFFTNTFTKFVSNFSGKLLRLMFSFIPVSVTSSKNRTTKPYHRHDKRPDGMQQT